MDDTGLNGLNDGVRLRLQPLSQKIYDTELIHTLRKVLLVLPCGSGLVGSRLASSLELVKKTTSKEFATLQVHERGLKNAIAVSFL